MNPYPISRPPTSIGAFDNKCNADQQRLGALRRYHDELKRTLSELETAESDEVFWARMELGARIVKLACDFAVQQLAPLGIAVVYDRVDLLIGVSGPTPETAIWKHIGSGHSTIASVALKAAGKTRIATAIRQTEHLALNFMSFADLVRHGRSQSGLPAARRTAAAVLEKLKWQILHVEAALHGCDTRAPDESRLLRGRIQPPRLSRP